MDTLGLGQMNEKGGRPADLCSFNQLGLGGTILLSADTHVHAEISGSLYGEPNLPRVHQQEMKWQDLSAMSGATRAETFLPAGAPNYQEQQKARVHKENTQVNKEANNNYKKKKKTPGDELQKKSIMKDQKKYHNYLNPGHASRNSGRAGQGTHPFHLTGSKDPDAHVLDG